MWALQGIQGSPSEKLKSLGSEQVLLQCSQSLRNETFKFYQASGLRKPRSELSPLGWYLHGRVPFRDLLHKGAVLVLLGPQKGPNLENCGYCKETQRQPSSGLSRLGHSAQGISKMNPMMLPA